MTSNEKPQRERVVLAHRRGARMVRTRVEVQEQTQVGDALVRGLVRAQLGLALRLAAVVVCAVAVALNYVVVYRQERAVDQTRQQIADQGPRIVEQMLTYGKDTMKDDFARAQSLATDGYRPQLIAQQEAVQKGQVVPNEYWAVSSAVLSASADQAAMLLAMQGQRGTGANDLRFITATVRADFEKSRSGQWRVSNLTVLKKPNLGGAPQ